MTCNRNSRRSNAVNPAELPGEGALPLNAMFDALPQGLTVGVEAPTRELAALSSPEAAKRAGDATRAFFDAGSTRLPPRLRASKHGT